MNKLLLLAGLSLLSLSQCEDKTDPGTEEIIIVNVDKLVGVWSGNNASYEFDNKGTGKWEWANTATPNTDNLSYTIDEDGKTLNITIHDSRVGQDDGQQIWTVESITDKTLTFYRASIKNVLTKQ